MNERILAAASGSGALVSITIEQVNTTISISAGVAAILAALPVIIDRWGPKLRALFARPPVVPPSVNPVVPPTPPTE